MKVSRVQSEINTTINGEKLEQVKSFKYLGHNITEDGRCETEIKSRIAQAKTAFSNRKELLTKGFKKDTKIKIIKTLIWSVLLYGSEKRALRKEGIRKIEALEMWIWRRMEGIKWSGYK